MDERLVYLDSDEKYELYNEWLQDVKATREKANKIYCMAESTTDLELSR